jgi:hypothetical protein
MACRLYTEEGFESLEDVTPPEIVRCDLASVVLQVKALGIENVMNFDFMDKCVMPNQSMHEDTWIDVFAQLSLPTRTAHLHFLKSGIVVR